MIVLCDFPNVFYIARQAVKLGNVSLKRQQTGEVPPSRVWGRAGHAREAEDIGAHCRGRGRFLLHGMREGSDRRCRRGWGITQGDWKAPIWFGRTHTHTRVRCEDRTRQVAPLKRERLAHLEPLCVKSCLCIAWHACAMLQVKHHFACVCMCW